MAKSRRRVRPLSGSERPRPEHHRHVGPATPELGVITRVAGTGTEGNSGDDGPATEAELHQPFGVAVTADGGFLIADSENHEVRN
jgi:hypothetical protein